MSTFEEVLESARPYHWVGDSGEYLTLAYVRIRWALNSLIRYGDEREIEDLVRMERIIQDTCKDLQQVLAALQKQIHEDDGKISVATLEEQRKNAEGDD